MNSFLTFNTDFLQNNKNSQCVGESIPVNMKVQSKTHTRDVTTELDTFM